VSIPPEYNDSITLWYNQIVGDLACFNNELGIFQKYWTQFTPAQQAAIKALVIQNITAGIASLELIKAEIQAIA